MWNELKTILDRSQRIVFFGGAGVSTESGVPDFRSETGLYQAKQEFGRSPEEMVSHSFYRRNPEMFFDYYKRYMVHPTAEPNDAHRALAKLEETGRLLGVVTQNIDGLHQQAGSNQVFELHGSVHRNSCVACGAFYRLEYVLNPKNCQDDQGNPGHTPRCKKCGGVVKPDVVLYEEALDQEVLMGAVAAISRADTMIVGGTSLVVYPAASLIQYFKGKDLVLINKGETPYDERAGLVIREPIGKVLGHCVL